MVTSSKNVSRADNTRAHTVHVVANEHVIGKAGRFSNRGVQNAMWTDVPEQLRY